MGTLRKDRDELDGRVRPSRSDLRAFLEDLTGIVFDVDRGPADETSPTFDDRVDRASPSERRGA